MPYPEKNAHYRNKPAWMDRAVAGEKRADGGVAEPLIDQRGRTVQQLKHPADFGVDVNEPPTRLLRPSSPDAAADAREQAAQRTRNTRAMPNSFPVGGDRKSGGRVRRRAEGGPVSEPLVDRRGRTLQQLAADDPDGAPLSLKQPSSPEAAQDARDQAAETMRRAATSPRTPGPITKSLFAAGATPLVLGRMTADTVSGLANKINSPEARDQIAEGMGRSNRRRGGRT